MREHAHQLLDRLDHSQLAAIVHLLETIIPPEDDGGDTLSNAEREKIAEADAWLAAGHAPIPHEEILADFGLSITDWDSAEKRLASRC